MPKKAEELSQPSEIKALLGEGTEFKGILSFDGTVRIDGRMDGEVVTEGTLIVGQNAVINAEISVGVLVAIGRITGNINASKKIEIHSSCVLKGNIKTPSLVIEEGAIFEGGCEMGKEKVDISLDEGKCVQDEEKIQKG